MSEITEGSLYSGYGGLGMALRAVSGLPVRTAWHCDPDTDCDATLAKHHPGVPNQRSDVDPVRPWSMVERPDVLTLGPPCQPVSAAGRGLGVDDGRWRWPYAYHALTILRPPVLFFENVANLAGGRQLPLWNGILADMRAAGYQVAWIVIGACVVGAPHHRHRLFAVGRLRDDPGPAVRVGVKAFCGTRMPLLPTPVTTDARGARNSTAIRDVSKGPGSGGNTLGDAVYRGDLLPTPQARDGDPQRGAPSPDLAVARLDSGRRNLPDAIGTLTAGRYGRYAPAVERWEGILGRSAPEPVEPTARAGGYRLAPALPEWMMGLPDGHLTGHLARPAALRLAGNGVCPQQAAEAWCRLYPLV